MTVVCQDASGRREEINVRADTDEAACTAALAILNSWRPIRVVAPSSTLAERARGRNPVAPTPREGEAETSEQVAPARLTDSSRARSSSVGPKIIKEAEPADWIDPRAHATTAVGRALLDARRRIAA